MGGVCRDGYPPNAGFVLSIIPRMSLRFLSLLAAVVTVVSAASMPAPAQSKPAASTPAPAPASVAQPAAQSAAITIAPAAAESVAVLNAYMGALANGQFDVARKFMAPNAVVLRDGRVLGSRDMYFAGEARADAAALHGAQRDLLRRDAKAGDGLALVLSEKRLRTTVGGKSMDQFVTETALLVKTLDGWKIAHLHVSSRPAPLTAAR